MPQSYWKTGLFPAQLQDGARGNTGGALRLLVTLFYSGIKKVVVNQGGDGLVIIDY